MHHSPGFARPTRAAVTLTALAVLLFYGFAVAQRAVHTFELRQEAVGLQHDIDNLTTRRTALANERKGLQDGTDVETIARHELNLIKSGETAVVVLPSQAAIDRARQPAPAQPQQQPPFWQVWWRALIGS